MELHGSRSALLRRTFTQEQFDAFARLSGDDNPIHVDPQYAAHTKFGRTVAHGMFLYAQVHRALGKLLPGSAHAGVELMFPAPTYAGEPVEIRLEPLEHHPEDDLALFTVTLIRPGGQVGLQGVLRALLPSQLGAFSLPPVEPAAPAAGGPQTWKGLRLGQRAVQQRSFRAEHLEGFARLVGDTNPLYTDPEVARRQGLRGCPLPGPLLGGMFSYLLGTELPGRGTNWLKQRIAFLAPAYPGETLTASVEITRLRPEKELANLRTWITGEAGETVCEGEALVWVSELEGSPAG